MREVVEINLCFGFIGFFFSIEEYMNVVRNFTLLRRLILRRGCSISEQNT